MAKTRSGPDPAKHTYAAAGVDLEAADEAVDLIGPMVRKTYGPRVLPSHGGFAGAFRLDYDEKLFARNYREPVLMAATDGVGSKLLVAIQAKRYDTLGVDLVAMNVNDLLAAGAEPLFLLDYIAVNKIKPAQVAALVAGVASGCEEAGCALLGGETAELPDLYRKQHFDLAAFAVGVIERSRMVDKRQVKPGDQVIGLASNGLHSNGYALARKVLLRDAGLSLKAPQRALGGEPLVEALLRPTRIYVRPVLDVLAAYTRRRVVVGLAHITGGGLEGNLSRVLPDNCDAVLRRGSWSTPRIYGLLQRYDVAEEELYRVFNMGIGFTLVVRPRSAAAVVRRLEKAGMDATVIGKIKRGKGRVEFQ